MLRRELITGAGATLVYGALRRRAEAQTDVLDLPLFGQSGPSLSLNFLTGTLDPRISFSRASGATSALYTDAAGAAFTTYTSGQPRLGTFSIGSGFLIEEAATNYLLNSNSPATQTTASLATGSYVLFGNGTGSLTSAAGTAVGTGFGTISTLTGNYQVITITTAGTVTITVSGTVDWFDLQGGYAGSVPSSHIVTTSTAATRATDSAFVPVSGLVPGGSVIARWVTPPWTGIGGTGSGASIAEIRDSGGSNAIQFYQGAGASSSALSVSVLSGGSYSINPMNIVNGLAASTIYRAGTSWSAPLVTGVVVPSTTNSSNSGIAPLALSALWLTGNTRNALGGLLQRVVLYSRKLNAAQLLQAASAL